MKRILLLVSAFITMNIMAQTGLTDTIDYKGPKYKKAHIGDMSVFWSENTSELGYAGFVCVSGSDTVWAYVDSTGQYRLQTSQAVRIDTIEFSDGTKLYSSSLNADSTALSSMEFYVSSNGSDLTGDGTVGSPFRTVDKATKEFGGYIATGDYGANDPKGLVLYLDSGHWSFDREILPYIRDREYFITLHGTNEFVFDAGTFTQDPSNELRYSNSAIDWTTTLDSNYMAYQNANSFRPIRAIHADDLAIPFRVAPTGNIYELKSVIDFEGNYNGLNSIEFKEVVCDVDDMKDVMVINNSNVISFNQVIFRGNLRCRTVNDIDCKNTLFAAETTTKPAVLYSTNNSNINNAYMVTNIIDNGVGSSQYGWELEYMNAVHNWLVIINGDGIENTNSNLYMYNENSFINTNTAYTIDELLPLSCEAWLPGTQLYIDSVTTFLHEKETPYTAILGRKIDFSNATLSIRGANTLSNVWTESAILPDRHISINWGEAMDVAYNSLNDTTYKYKTSDSTHYFKKKLALNDSIVTTVMQGVLPDTSWVSNHVSTNKLTPSNNLLEWDSDSNYYRPYTTVADNKFTYNAPSALSSSSTGSGDRNYGMSGFGSTSWVGNLSGDIFKSSDGAAWVEQTSPLSSAIKAIGFANANTGWAVAVSEIAYTANGGTTWSAQTAATNHNSLSVVSVDTVYVASDNGYFYKTVNAGTTWTGATIPTADDNEGIHFYDADTGWVCEETGKVFKTINGGTTWTAQTVTQVTFWRAIYFMDSDTGWVVGNTYGNKTIDGGTTWTEMTNLPSANHDFIHFDATNQILYTVSTSGVLYKSTDFGENWSLYYNLSGATYGSHLNVTDQYVIIAQSSGVTKKYEFSPDLGDLHYNAGITIPLTTSYKDSTLVPYSKVEEMIETEYVFGDDANVATTTLDLTLNTYKKVEDQTNNLFAQVNNNTLTIVADSAVFADTAKYDITFRIVGVRSAASSFNCTWSIIKNGTTIIGNEWFYDADATRKYYEIHYRGTLNAGDYIHLQMKNTSDNADFDVLSASLVIDKLP